MKRHLRAVHDGTRFRAVGPSLSLSQDEVAEIVRLLNRGWLWRWWGGRKAGARHVIIEKLRAVAAS